ncbi:MAG: hypothetical protein ACE5HX_17590 [bacterium]
MNNSIVDLRFKIGEEWKTDIRIPKSEMEERCSKAILKSLSEAF